MKTGKIVVALAGLATVAGIAWAFIDGGHRDVSAQSNTPAAEQKAISNIVEVDDLAEKPSEHRGEITMRAVIARVNREAGLFSVIDAREYEACKSVTCAKNYLPIKFTGELPGPETLVELSGETVKSEKGLVFEAKTLKVVK